MDGKQPAQKYHHLFSRGRLRIQCKKSKIKVLQKSKKKKKKKKKKESRPEANLVSVFSISMVSSHCSPGAVPLHANGHISLNYEPRVAVVLKHCQGCMRVHVCVGFVMGRL